jgi:DNA-binding NtrC family response regulator
MENKKLKILIADDEEGLRLSMAGILELEGHDVITAGNGYEAIEHVKTGSFDIAFLDIKMPGINGVETFKEIKKLSPETVVIMMTAFAVKDLIREAISEGAYACISKPFDMDRIIETIQEVSKKPFVVVIDDDPHLCELLYKQLRESGFNVVTKTSGIEGIELVQRKIPDVVFLDVVMRGMDGIETLKELKQLLGTNLPKTIIMSGHDIDNKFEEARQLGAAECINKPMNILELKDMVYKVLDKDKKLRICVVDDDKTLCDSLKSVLDSNGYEVDVAYSGNEVIEKIKSEVFKVIILDIRLPDINGIDVYEQIKHINSDIGVIFVSGYTNDEHINNTIQKNNYTYLHKPFEPENLIKMIEEVKESKKR